MRVNRAGYWDFFLALADALTANLSALCRSACPSRDHIADAPYQHLVHLTIKPHASESQPLCVRPDLWPLLPKALGDRLEHLELPAPVLSSPLAAEALLRFSRLVALYCTPAAERPPSKALFWWFMHQLPERLPSLQILGVPLPEAWHQQENIIKLKQQLREGPSGLILFTRHNPQTGAWE